MITQGYKIPAFRIQLVREGEIEALGLTGPDDVANIAAEYAMWDREVFVCLHLDTKNNVIGREIVSMGTLNHTLVHPREIFKSAILANSAHVILCHNHPSGTVDPSKEDDTVTARLAEAGRLLGIPVLDHVIVGPRGHFYSYEQENPKALGK